MDVIKFRIVLIKIEDDGVRFNIVVVKKNITLLIIINLLLKTIYINMYVCVYV